MTESSESQETRKKPVNDFAVFKLGNYQSLSESGLSDLQKNLNEHISPTIGMPVLLCSPSDSMEIHRDLSGLVVAIDRQTQAINELVKSNAMVIQCFVEAVADEEELPQTNFLDGTPINSGTL